MLFAFGAITFYEGNNMLSALAKYVINRLMHGLFHIALVISPRLISSLGLKPSRRQIITIYMYIDIKVYVIPL